MCVCVCLTSYVRITITSEGHRKNGFHRDLTLARNPGGLLLSTRKHSQQDRYTWSVSTISIKHFGFRHRKLRNHETKGRLGIFFSLIVRFTTFPLDRYPAESLLTKSTRKNNALWLVLFLNPCSVSMYKIRLICTVESGNANAREIKCRSRMMKKRSIIREIIRFDKLAGKLLQNHGSLQ